MLDLIPVGNRIIIKQIEIEQIGSIIIPTNSREVQELIGTEGEVIAIGPDCRYVKKGDQVFYGKYAGFDIKRQGEVFKVMSEMDVVGFVNTQEHLLQEDPIVDPREYKSKIDSEFKEGGV